MKGLKAAGFSIPADFPLDELVGQELSNLSIGRHYLMLSFIQIKTAVSAEPKYGSGARVEIESGFEYKGGLGQSIKAESSDLATPATNLIPLLGQSITTVGCLPNNELSLQFGETGTLILTVDNQGYESYHLYIGEQSVDITKAWCSSALRRNATVGNRRHDQPLAYPLLCGH
jgi:hypothetical protein